MAAMYSAQDFFDLGSFEDARKIIKKMLEDGAKAADKLADSIAKLSAIDQSYTKILKEKQIAVAAMNQELLNGKQISMDMTKSLQNLSKEFAEMAKNVGQVRKENEKLKDDYNKVNKATNDLGDSTRKLENEFDKAQKKAKEFADGSLAQMKQRLKELKNEYENLGKAADEATKDSVIIKIKNLTDEIKKEETALKEATKATKEQDGAYTSLSKQLNEMRKRYKDMAAAEDTASDEAKQLLKDIQKLDTQLKDIDASVGQFQRNVGNYTDAFKGLGSGIGGAIGNMTGLGDLFAGGGAFAMGAAAAALLVQGIVALTESTLALQKNMTEIQTLTKRTGDDLIETTSQVKALSDVFEQDFNMTAKASYTLMNTFGETSANTFDILSRGLAPAGSEGDEFLDNIREYGPQFKAFGFTAAQTVGFLSTGIQEGAYKIDKVGDAINNAKIELQRFDVGSLNSFLKGSDLKVVRDIIQEYQAAPEKMGAGVKVVSNLSKEINRLGVNSKAGGELITKVFTAIAEEGLDPKKFFKQLEGIGDANKKLTENLTESQLALIAQAQAVQKTQSSMAEFALITKGAAGSLGLFFEEAKAEGAKGLVDLVNEFKMLSDEISLFIGFVDDTFTAMTDLFGVTEHLADAWAYLKELFTGSNDAMAESSDETQTMASRFVELAKNIQPLYHLYNVFKVGLSYIKNAQAAAYGAANAMKLLKDAWVISINELAADLKGTFERIKSIFTNVYDSIYGRGQDIYNKVGTIFTNIVSSIEKPFDDFKEGIKEFMGYDEFVEVFYQIKRGANQIFDDLSRDFNAVINKVGEVIDKGIGYFTDFKDAILNELQPTTDAIKGFVQPIIDFIQNIVKTITDGVAGFNAMGSAIESVKSKLPKSLFKEEEESVFKKALKKYTDDYDFAMKKMTKSEEDRIKERNKLLTDDAKDKAEKAKAESKLTAEQQESLNKSLYELRKQRLVFAQTLAKEEAADEQNIFEDRLESFKIYENKKKAEIELTRRFEIAGADKAAKSEGEKGLMIAKINENAKEAIRKTEEELTAFLEKETKKREDIDQKYYEDKVKQAEKSVEDIEKAQERVTKIKDETVDIGKNMRVVAINEEIKALEDLMSKENLSAEERMALMEKVNKKKNQLATAELDISRKKLETEYNLNSDAIDKQIKVATEGDNKNLELAQVLREEKKALEDKYYTEVGELNTNFNTKVQENDKTTTDAQKKANEERKNMWIEAIGGGLLTAFESSQQKRINGIQDENEKFKQQILLKVKMIGLEIVLKKIMNPKAEIQSNLAGGLGSLIGTIGGGLYEGGYTDSTPLFTDKNGRSAVDFVHANEYVVPEKSMKNPIVSQMVKTIDIYRTTGNKDILFSQGMRGESQISEPPKQAQPLFNEDSLAEKIGANIAKNMPTVSVNETVRNVIISEKQNGNENRYIIDKIAAKMGRGF